MVTAQDPKSNGYKNVLKSSNNDHNGNLMKNKKDPPFLNEERNKQEIIWSC